MTMTTGPTPALMKQINEAFNGRDVDRIMSFFAEDCTFLMSRALTGLARLPSTANTNGKT